MLTSQFAHMTGSYLNIENVVLSHTCTRTHTHIHTHTSMYAHTCMHTHTQTNTHKDVLAIHCFYLSNIYHIQLHHSLARTCI